MDNDILIMVIKLVIIMPAMIAILYFLLKYSNTKLQAVNKNKIISVIEKTAITKNSYMMVVKIADEYYVMHVNSDKSRIIKKIDKEKVEEIRKNAMKPEDALSPDISTRVEGIIKSFVKKREKKNEDK
ncbi:Flagellar biosynthesis protein, FliO [Hathewaya proteolytica DSM 3090]|uniref:Flagellar biosynthesis protein, FliO n=1 Tax=Hathewaya proteolytica DSM 3090 TaxID=1121331 RepID=A0A1M6L9S3_9CLOT|nr:flagellar biosynthetic protein FliO [Hathewaya proteolytica]SHJ67914.1 Flagellar biosynthesis protein, FliO [Hathewaya proteolytica DSM 3090]